MLISLYSNQTATAPRYFSAGDGTISQVNERLFYNTEPLWQTREPLVGVTANEKYITLAFSNELALLSHDGELLEHINYLPRQITTVDRIGHDDNGRFVLQGDDTTVIAAADMLSWQGLQGDSAITWSRPLEAGEVTDKPALPDRQYPELTWERLLLDLHSGRILGTWGPYLMDTMALAMVFLVFTGLWRWWKLQKATRSR
jgi:hypothetical protein